VAAHGGHQEGRTAPAFHKVHDGTQQRHVLVDAAAAAGDGNAVTGPDGGAGFLQLSAQVLMLALLLLWELE
jgi:hypothetical protein